MAAKPVPSVPPVASSAEQEPSTQAEEAPAAASGAAPAAPGQFEVDEEAAERALERTLVVTGALLLPFGQADIQPSFTYIRSQAGGTYPLLRAREAVYCHHKMFAAIPSSPIFFCASVYPSTRNWKSTFLIDM